MESTNSKLVSVFGGATALVLAVGAFLITQRPSPRSKTPATAVANVRSAAPAAPLIVRRTTTPAVHAAATGEGTTPAVASPQSDSEYINRRYQDQVYPEVTIRPNLQRDNPAEYERLVRLHNPDYAKILDEQAAAEKSAASP